MLKVLSFLHSTVIVSTLSETTDTTAVPLISTAQVVCTTTDYINYRLIFMQNREYMKIRKNRPTSEQTLKRVYQNRVSLTIPKGQQETVS